MMLQKVKPWRSKKWRSAAWNQQCVRCGKMDGTTVFAHYSGLMAHIFGKGGSIKGHDCIGADLCHKCHNWYDRKEYLKEGVSSETASFYFMMDVAKTVVRRLKDGY